MKKLLCIAFACALLLCLLACQSGNSEDDMKKAYIEQFGHNSDISPDDLEIDSYGTYNGCTVAYINGPFMYMTVLGGETVGEYVFKYPDSQRLKAYKNGEYKSMRDAYEAGWLNDHAVEQVLQKHKKAMAGLYQD